jgi:nucleotide-binding universal stress UspA family protein
MITFQRILFPVDFSERSAAVVPSVQAMVKRFGSKLTVLHVVDLPPAVGIAPPEAAAWATLIGADRLREDGKIALQRFVAREFPGAQVRAESAEGDPSTAIVDYVRENQADLIMMPSSGRGRFRRLLLGSVTAKVLHDTAVPVWTGVHTDEIAAHPPDRWKHALCAVNDDPRDLPALKWAAEFASEQKLELRLVHAVLGAEDCEEDPSLREFLYNVARKRIDKLQAEAGTDFEVCLRGGNAGRVVHDAAIGHSADIVVIGRGLIQTALGRLRSGAYEIIREAPCPVISV